MYQYILIYLNFIYFYKIIILTNITENLIYKI